MDKSPWDSTAICIFFRLFSSLLKQCIIFEIFLQFSLPLPYTKLKLRKNFGSMRPTLFVGDGRGPTCVNWKTPQKRTIVPRLLSMIVVASRNRDHRPYATSEHSFFYICYRKIHYLTREFHVKLHAKTDIARITKR